jgi:N utilization substance protein A
MNLIESFSEFKAGKNIDRPTMVRVMEDVFRTLIKKKYGSDEHFDIIVNMNGDLQLWRVRKIVPDGEVMNEQGQVSLSEAKSIDDSYELDEDCYEERLWQHVKPSSPESWN